jgi:hypothetical protein
MSCCVDKKYHYHIEIDLLGLSISYILSSYITGIFPDQFCILTFKGAFIFSAYRSTQFVFFNIGNSLSSSKVILFALSF